MRQHKQLLSSYNDYPRVSSIVMRPEKYSHLKSLPGPVIARGSGTHPTDGAIHENQHVVLMERLNRFLSFDEERAILQAEAGVTVGEILRFFVPRGWFLPVLPTSSKSTLGGCVATDIHGKNHHHEGGFSKHVHSIELISFDGTAKKCSSKEEKDLFFATIGGMGLTGVISEVSLKMIHVETAYMVGKRQLAQNFDQLFQTFQEAAAVGRYAYAWVDCLANGKGLVVHANHASLQQLPQHIEEPLNMVGKSRCCPSLCLPNWVIHPTTRRALNRLYYQYQSRRSSDFLIDCSTFFFPSQQERWRSKKGAVAYEFFVPKQSAYKAILKVIEALSKSGFSASSAFLQVCGKGSEGYLSFAKEGFAFQFSLPLTQDSPFAFLNQLDQIVLEHGGHVCLAKDVRLQPHTFRSMYPQLHKWQNIKASCDPRMHFASNLSKRLELGNKQ